MGNSESTLSDEQIKEFKDWVQSRDSKPYIWDARQWFQSSQHIRDDIPEASLDTILGPLIEEAMKDATTAIKKRNKVLLTSISSLYRCCILLLFIR
jgi:hypothetical protein